MPAPKPRGKATPARPFGVGANGDVHAPTAPGIGAEIDWDLINYSVIGTVA